MLHNVLIKANKHTEIAKQGKFINIVLASGELSARIRMGDGQIFETKLISGMSFPVPQGYVSVAFTSETSQQTRIWLGDLPLTYSPLDSKIVGSSSAQTTESEVYYNTFTEVLPARVGRQKAILYCAEDFYFGGQGVTYANAMKHNANTPLQLDTQAPILAFSKNSLLERLSYIKTSASMTFKQTATVTGTTEELHYNPLRNEYFSHNGEIQTRPVTLFDGDTTTITTENTEGGFVKHTRKLTDATLGLFQFDNSDMYYTVLDLADYSQISKTLLISGVSNAVYSADIVGQKWLVVMSSGGQPAYSGNIDGTNCVLIDKSGAGSPTGGYAYGLINNDGDTVLISKAGKQTAITGDNGATWQNGSFSTFAREGGFCDRSTGYIYLAQENGWGFSFMRSIDGGVTFHLDPVTAEQDGAGWGQGNKAHKVLNGHFYFIGEGRYFITYSPDDGWARFDLGAVLNPDAVSLNSDGSIIISSPNNQPYSAFVGEIAHAGGLMVSAFETIN